MPPPPLRPLLARLAFVVFFLLFLWLGRWQLQRMHEKEALFTQFESGAIITLPLSKVDPATARYQHVIATGRYDSQHQFLLDNMTHEERAGYRVLTPLIGPDGSAVLVDRGWRPMGASREQLPDVAVPDNLRGLSGTLDDPPRAGIHLAGETGQGWPRVLSYPTLGELEKAYGHKLFPRIILLDADQPDGFLREWRPATFPPERHLAYAVTWFALAATVFVTFAIVRFRRKKQR